MEVQSATRCYHSTAVWLHLCGAMLPSEACANVVVVHAVFISQLPVALVSLWARRMKSDRGPPSLFSSLLLPFMAPLPSPISGLGYTCTGGASFDGNFIILTWISISSSCSHILFSLDCSSAFHRRSFRVSHQRISNLLTRFLKEVASLSVDRRGS